MKKLLAAAAVVILAIGVSLVLMLGQSDKINELELSGLENSYKDPKANGYNRYVVEENGIYFINIMDSIRLYRMGLNGKNIIKVLDENLTSFEIADGWIYYSTLNGLYKIKTDGSSTTLLTDDKVIGLSVTGNQILYNAICERDDGKIVKDTYHSLYKINVDGTSKSKFCDEMISDFTNSGDWVYYTVSSEPYFNMLAPIIKDKENEEKKATVTLYRMKLDGTNKEIVTDVLGVELTCYRSVLYYYKDDGYYSLDMNSGGAGKRIMTQLPYSIDFDGEYAYYTADMHNLYKMELRTGNSKKILRENNEISQIDVLGEWIFYHSGRRSILKRYVTEVKAVKNDGSRKQLFIRDYLF